MGRGRDLRPFPPCLHPMNPSLRSPALPRRAFLQSLGAAATVAAVAGRPLYGAASAVRLAPNTGGTVPVAFHEPVDLLICGSTLFACQLAIDAARAGRRTALVMDRVNPYFEGIACLRSWVEEVDLPGMPAMIRSIASNPQTSERVGSRSYFNASKAALVIEDQLCEAGVRFYYNAAVAGALGSGDELAGVVFGGKTGFWALEAGLVIDATVEATVARACGAPVDRGGPGRRYRYVADLAKPVPARSVRYRSASGVSVEVRLEHYHAAFEMEFTSDAQGPFALAEEYERVYAASLECPWTGAEKRFRGADGCLAAGLDRVRVEGGLLPGQPRLRVLGPEAIPGNREGALALADPLALFRAFPDAWARLPNPPAPAPGPRPQYAFWNRAVAADPGVPAGAVHSFQDHGFSEPRATLEPVRFQPPATAVSCEVLVAGGGTSGNAAAYSAARLGLDTLCLERGPELGGTNTIGGVTNLWFGRKTRAFEDYYAAMNARNDGINAPGFYRGVRQAGAKLLFQTVITGVMAEGREIRRVYVATPLGLTAVAARHLIDATGDGSLAAWAGCAYGFGGEHDELTLWASFAGYRPGNPEALRPFLSPLDERSPVDVTRFILGMRRNSKISFESKHVPPPFFVAPRESRHVRGGRTVTFLDVLAGRRFRDGVLRVESNPDIKGVATSDAAKAGFIPTNWKTLYQVTVPYGALLPLGIDNVILAGKAYSVTHDTLSTARMQRDLCVLGLVAGEAVQLARERDVRLRDVPVAELQPRLIAKGMLRPEDLAADDLGFGRSPAEIAAEVARASDLDECLPASARLCLLPREQVLPLLEPHAAPDAHAVNRVLGFLGSGRGLAAQRELVRQALAEPVLSPELFGGKGTAHLMPDQGYAPWTALRLGALARAQDPSVVPLLVQLAPRISRDVKDLRSSWGYFYSLACGFERMPAEAGREPLRHLLTDGLFHSRVISRRDDLRACRDIPAERLAYLRLALARALTRCGDAAGARILCEFLDEARVCYARAARSELVAASGQDFGFDAERWQQWLADHGSRLRPNPLTTPWA